MLVTNFKKRTRRAGLVLLLSFLIGFGIFSFTPNHNVRATPDHEVTHYYYDGPDYSNQVGVRYVTCYGIQTYGQVTQYVFTVDGDPCY